MSEHRLYPLVRERWDILVAIALGGALGSLARWAVGEVLPHRAGQIPWSTFLENVSGALLLGALMVFVLDLWPTTRYVRPFLAVGVLGGYTTFSTYMLDTRTLVDRGAVGPALAYLFGTLLAGLVAVWAGILLARTAVRLLTRRRRKR
ncbi:MAG TPA: fluoride efflux transporter CrcB [Nocardioidaceae bacterium]|jgi:CrcB protein